jgi:hypothetical protein
MFGCAESSLGFFHNKVELNRETGNGSRAVLIVIVSRIREYAEREISCEDQSSELTHLSKQGQT